MLLVVIAPAPVSKFKSVTLTFEGGHSYTTSVNASVPNEEINNYFFNKEFDIGGDDEHIARCVKVLIKDP